MQNSHTHKTARLIAALAVAAAMLVIPAGSVFAGEPTLTKSLSQTQPFANDDGTFPSGATVTYEVSIGCNAPGDCDDFELHDLAPTFTDVNGAPGVYEFVSASPGGAGPNFDIDASDPSDIALTFPDGFSAGTSMNIQMTFAIPAGVTPDNTTATNTAIWGEFDDDGNPLPNTVTDTQDVTSRARTSFDVVKTGPATVNPNTPVEFVVSLCGDNPDDPYFGPLDGTVENATLTDQIPAGFVIVDAGGGTDNGDGTVTWDLGDVDLGPGDCVDRTITLEYPATGPITEPIASSNVVVAGGDFPPDGDGNPGSGDVPFVIDNPSPGEPGIDKRAGRPYVDLDLNDGATGDDGDSFSSYYLQPENTGEGVIFDAILTDPIPDRFAVTRFDTGTWPTGPTGPNDDSLVEFVFTFLDGSSQSIFADGVTGQSVDIADEIGNPLVQVAVNYGDLPAGWVQNGGEGRSELYGYFIDPGRSGGDPIDFDDAASVAVVNTATLVGTVVDPVTGDLVSASDSDTATINIESPQPHPAVFKSVSAAGNTFGNGVFPSNDDETTTLTWTVRIQNHWTATEVYPDPVIVDLLPTLTPNALGQGGLSDAYDFTVNTPAGVTCPVVPADGGSVANTATGLDDTVLIWECTGDLARTENITITFKTDVEAGTPPQSILNRDYTTTNALTDDGSGQYFSAWNGGAFFGEWQDDVDDLDGDGDTTDRIRTDVASIEVLDFVFLESVKQVRGGPDAECNGDSFPPAGQDNTTYGIGRCTRPGGIVDYEMVVTNRGNTDIVNLMVMDIFPAVGDSFVVPNQNTGAVGPRNSAFDTYLTGPVTSPDPNVVVEYSVEQEPCRYDDFYPSNAGAAEVPGCSPANWTTTPPSPISSARAIRISYVDPATGDVAVLEIDDTFVLEWPMRASVAAQTDDIATNAFGWSAQSATSDTVNTAGPAPVDISVAALDDFFLGDQVWYDENYDGTQDEGPLVGVPQVPVAVFLDNNGNGVLDADDIFVQETVTDSAPGFEGQYLFSDLPAGDYFVAFAPPSDWVVSPAFQGGDTAVDSNGTEAPAFPTTLWDPAAVNGPLFDDIFVSDVVNLGPDNSSVDTPNDLTIDLGLWRPDPAIDIEKATNAADADAPTVDEDADVPPGRFIPEGEDVTWSYVVTNTGNTVLDNVAITDDNGTPDPADDLSTSLGTITCPLTTLAPDESMTCTSTTPVAAIAGQYTNTADVIGDPVLPDIPWSEDSYADLERLDGTPFYDADGEIVPVADDDPSNYFGAIATVDIEKSTNGVAADGVGSEPAGPVVPVLDAVQWTYVVTIPAPGNVPLAEVVLIDDNGTPADTSDDLTTANGDFTFVGGDSNDNGLLDVDETWTYTADAPDGAVLGIYENTADVIGTPVTPDGTPIENPDGTPMEQPEDDDPSHYYGIAVPAIDIEKSTNGVAADLPGTDPAGPEILAGSDVTWTYVIANIGNVDLEVTGFVDDQIGAISACEEDATESVFPVILAPTESVTCTFTAPNGAAIGEYINIADVTGTPLDPDGNEITENVTPDGPIPVDPPEDDDPSNYTGVGTPGIDIEKTTNGFQADDPTGDQTDINNTVPYVELDDQVTWEYVITNTGDFALLVDEFSDDQIVDVSTLCVEPDLFPVTLQPTESVTCTVIGVATAQPGDLYINVADVIGVAVDPSGDPIVDQDGNDPFVDPEGESTIIDDDPSAYFGAGPGIDLEKSTNGFDADTGTGPFVALGGQVTWVYDITNTGNTDLVGLVVTDSVEGEICRIDFLAIGETQSCELVLEASTLVGQYANGSNVVAQPVDQFGEPIVDPVTGEPVDPIGDSDPSHYFGAEPGIDIEKSTNGEDADTGTGPFIALGAEVTWTYVVTNTGNVPLTGIVVIDDQEGEICTIPLLLAGETETCESFMPADTIGQYENLGEVVGTPSFPIDPDGDPTDPENYDPIVDPESGDPIPDVDDEDPSHYFGINPGVDIEKTTNGEDADVEGSGPIVDEGETVAWVYTITNVGDTPLIDLEVADDVEGDICVIPLLLPGDSTTCTAFGFGGRQNYRNVGSVTGTPAGPVDPDGDLSDPDNYEPIDTDPVTDDDPSGYSVGIVLDTTLPEPPQPALPDPTPPVLPDPNPTTGPDALPETGANSTFRLLTGGLGLLAAGLLLLVGTRRRRDREVIAAQ